MQWPMGLRVGMPTKYVKYGNVSSFFMAQYLRNTTNQVSDWIHSPLVNMRKTVENHQF